MRRALTFAFPGDLGLNTGGYAYDRKVIAELEKLGWIVQPLSLGGGFPVPSEDVRIAAEGRLSALADGSLVMIDGLAFGVLGDWASREASRLRIVALVHHPLALESGLGPEAGERFRRAEEKALRFARHVVVTSPMTARELAMNYGIDAVRITVAVPGTEPAPASVGNRRVPRILSIGTLTPRKGHDVLLAALKAVEDLAWSAMIVGSRALSPDTAAALERQLETLGLRERVELAGECDDTRALLATTDIFALASRYEGYGMALAEALSQGVPVVSCRVGAIPDVVPDEAGILVPVDDSQAFAEALRSLLSDADLRRSKADAARRAGAKLPGWQTTATILSAALEARR